MQLKLLLSGKVQGVGFRPFVYRLATQYQLSGYVKNIMGQVAIVVQGSQKQLQQFEQVLITRSPAIADPQIISSEAIKEQSFRSFEIKTSEAKHKADIHIPADYHLCEDCQRDIKDPHNRCYRYPFTNCTQCGPRYTLIKKLPYDRPNTTMQAFPLCSDCLREYQDITDRRFHAEPVACPVCGPKLFYRDPKKSQLIEDNALQCCVDAIAQGKVVAAKGVGGYHLICDALNDLAVFTLRQNKKRPDKPLAVMFPAKGEDECDLVREAVVLGAETMHLLRSPARPIVLAKKIANSRLSAQIAPKLDEIGVMLPYSPLHYLLLEMLDRPLVATSANLTGEPVIIDSFDAENRLYCITHHYLHHNREIMRPADDSVYRNIAGKLRPIRLGRGYAPIEISLPFSIEEPFLACGSHMKNTIALAWGNRLVVSPHIADLNSLRSMQVFEQHVEELQQLYHVKVKQIVCDAHPQYASTRWAKKQALPLTKIQHHKAHASALAMEYWNNDPWLVFTWDGTGFGDDGAIWGGEAFYGRPGNWQRLASMRPFRLPGGDKASREPWRSACALCWEEGLGYENQVGDIQLLKQAWDNGMNSPKSSAVGRLFDAAAALIGLIDKTSFEGQAPMLLEVLCESLYETEPLPLIKHRDGCYLADWAEFLPQLLDASQSEAERATLFHSRLAHTLIQQVELIAAEYKVTQIGLSGGVFQNRKLSNYVAKVLQKSGYEIYLPEKLPVNDGGISAGQVVEAVMQYQHSSIKNVG